MILRVSFTLNHVRKTGISTKNGTYLPDWVSDSKPTYNGGDLLIDGDRCDLGQTVNATIRPFTPPLWCGVRVGDVLMAMEGPKQVGEANVLSVGDE
jgi:hypothetical protein